MHIDEYVMMACCGVLGLVFNALCSLMGVLMKHSTMISGTRWICSIIPNFACFTGGNTVDLFPNIPFFTLCHESFAPIL